MNKKMTLTALLMINPMTLAQAEGISHIKADLMAKPQNEAKMKAQTHYMSSQVVHFSRQIYHPNEQHLEQVENVPHLVQLVLTPLVVEDSLFYLGDIPVVQRDQEEFELTIQYVSLDERFDSFADQRFAYYARSGRGQLVVYECSSSYQCENDERKMAIFDISPKALKVVKMPNYFFQGGQNHQEFKSLNK